MAVCTVCFAVAALAITLRTALSGRAKTSHWAATLVLGAVLPATAALLWISPPATSAIAYTCQGLLLGMAMAVWHSARLAQTEHRVALEEALDTTTIDSLTRVASHRAFQDRLSHECDRAYRFGDTFLLLVLDLDDFHPVNNRHGHRTGDRILMELAGRLRAQLREIDLVARFGGDQFALILPHTYEKAGLEVAERLRRNIAASVFLAVDGTELRLTTSIGVCSYPQDGTTPPALVESAFSALRFAKKMGGNQVQAACDTPTGYPAHNVVPLPHSGRGAIVRSLAAAVDVRDGYTSHHGQMVSELAAAIAKRMGLPSTEVSSIRIGGYLHDVGKIGVPDAILSKKGSLSSDEWEKIRQHPVLGKQIVEQAPELTDVIPLVLHHQERFDGSGYPNRLQGEDIPLGARIIAAADAYHAIRSNRPYRSGRTHEEASRELARCSGRQFDPRIVQALLAVLEEDEDLLQMTVSENFVSLTTTASAASV